MNRHIAFVATEIDPIAPGGAGAVVAGLAEGFAAAGDRVTVVLVSDASLDLRSGVVGAVADPTDLAEEGPHLARAKAAARVLRGLAGAEHLDAVEFQDFEGLGFWALSHRDETGIAEVPTLIRYHLTADHILEAIGVDRPEFDLARLMEREALRAADGVIVQAPSMTGTIADRYGLDPDRVVFGPPPVPEVGQVTRDRDPDSPRFAIIGRLSEQKGIHDALLALSPTLSAHPEMTIELIGADGWSATADVSMREWVGGLVEERVAGRVIFTGPLPRDTLVDHLGGTWAVLVPSRLESFGLAAHEARRMGLPVIARSQPAIDDFFDEAHGALVYRDDAGLVACIESVLRDPALLDRLAAAPAPRVGDAMHVYEDLPPVRHPQSQAGLATAAMHRLTEAVSAPSGRQTGRIDVRRGAATALRWLPEPIAAAAVRWAPQRLKDRFRTVVSWPVEQERRLQELRIAAVKERIDAGDFEALGEPTVSIVIPCYNHGRFLEGAILSCFEQTRSDFEIIVVDDGSMEAETRQIIDALDWPGTSVVRQDNAGLPAARNSGIERAHGRYIVPLDADDRLLPEYLATLVAALDAEPRAAFAHCWAELFGDVNWVWATRPYNPYTVLLSNSVLQTAMFRRSAWEEVGGYDPTMTSGNEDWDLWLRFQERGHGQLQVRRALYRYRKHGISMSVETEADFEAGRGRLIERHPSLYEPGAMSAAKSEWYPLLTAIVSEGAPGDIVAESLPGDAEVVVIGEPDQRLAAAATTGGWSVRSASDECGAVRVGRGKYVVFYREGATSSALDALVDRLERSPDLGAAKAGENTVYRRWALVDPGSGLVFPDDVEEPSCPQDGWMIPERMNVEGRDLAVVGQRPEEEGRLPAWVVVDR